MSARCQDRAWRTSMPCAERKAEEMRSTLIFAKVASYCKAHAIGALSQQVAWSAASAPARAAKFWTPLWTRVNRA